MEDDRDGAELDDVAEVLETGPPAQFLEPKKTHSTDIGVEVVTGILERQFHFVFLRLQPGLQ